jgi:hypothetical protein
MNIRYCLWLALAPLTLVQASEPAGTLTGWQGGDTALHMMRADGEVGRVGADGQVTLSLPNPPASRQTAARTFARCEGLDVSGGDVTVAPAMFFIHQGEAENYLFATTSREVADWQASFGETPLAEGAWLQWLHSTGEARVSGTCKRSIHTGSSGDEPGFEEQVHYEVTLAPGWNRVRFSIDKLHVEPDGTRHIERQRVHTVAAAADDIRWHLERP